MNGSNFWQIETGIAWLWLDELYLEMSNEQPQYQSVFAPQTISLTEPPPAPILSPEVQLAFDNSGGGGDGGTLQVVDDGCRIDARFDAVTYHEQCVAIYPFSLGEPVEITIRQASGEPITGFQLVSEPIHLRISGSSDILTYGVKVYIPTKLGVTEGVYVIDAIGTSETRQVAYKFDELYSREFDGEATITDFCDNGERTLVGNRFSPNSQIELVFLEDIGIVGDQFIGTLELRERYRWTFTTGIYGEFLATIDLDLDTGYFVLADSNGNWESNFPQILANFFFDTDGAPLAERLFEDRCAEVGMLIPDIIVSNNSIASDNYALTSGARYTGDLQGTAEWTFAAVAGDRVTINLESDDLDPILELRDVSDMLIAEDDDSGERTNARLEAIQILGSGEYRVIVRSWGDKTGTYSIRLQVTTAETASEGLSVPPATILPPTPTTAAAAATFCPEAPPTRLEVGAIAVQALSENPIRVRAEPRSGTTIQYLLYPNQQVTVIGGPECSALDDGNLLIWWQIENSDGLTGWVAEGTSDTYFLASSSQIG